MNATPEQLRDAARQLDEGESIPGALFPWRDSVDWIAYSSRATALMLRLEAELQGSYTTDMYCDFALARLVRQHASGRKCGGPRVYRPRPYRRAGAARRGPSAACADPCHCWFRGGCVPYCTRAPAMMRDSEVVQLIKHAYSNHDMAWFHSNRFVLMGLLSGTCKRCDGTATNIRRVGSDEIAHIDGLPPYSACNPSRRTLKQPNKAENKPLLPEPKQWKHVPPDGQPDELLRSWP